MALLSIYIIWGSTYLAIRFAVDSMPPLLMAGTRFLVAGGILFVWRLLAGDPIPSRLQWRSAAIIGLLLLLGGNGLVSWSEQHVASGIAAVLIGTVPLFMVIIEALRPGGTRPGWQSTLGLLTGFSGIVLLVSGDNLGGKDAPINLLAAGALLLASLLWSLGSIYSRSVELPVSSLMGTGIEMLAGGLGLYLAGSLAGEWQQLQFSSLTHHSWFALGYLIVFGSLVGYVAYTWLLRHAPVSLVATYAYVNPIVALILGAWLGDEKLTLRSLLAGLIIISSVIVINTAHQSRVIQKDEVVNPAAE